MVAININENQIGVNLINVQNKTWPLRFTQLFKIFEVIRSHELTNLMLDEDIFILI